MIISVFGSGGSGKTTIAKILAEKLSQENTFSVIIDCESRFGAFARQIGGNVPLEKSLKRAVLDTENLNLYENTWGSNVSYFSMADEEGVDSYLSTTDEILEEFLENLKLTYDFIIFDCTQNIKDDLTSFALQKADLCINVINSSVQGLAFHNAHKPAFEYLNLKEYRILNKNFPNNLNQSTAENIIGQEIHLSLSFSVSVLEKSLYLESEPKFEEKVSKSLSVLMAPKKEEGQNKKGFSLFKRKK